MVSRKGGMASKRGVLITAGILGAITVASFLVWNIPYNQDTVFVVSDFEANLDGVKNIHKSINAELDEKFQGLLDGDVDAQEYINSAEAATWQINAEIIKVVNSGPTEEWEQSYIGYMESLRQSNSHIRETIVFANMAKDGASQDRLEEALDAIGQLKARAEALAMSSDDARP